MRPKSCCCLASSRNDSLCVCLQPIMQKLSILFGLVNTAMSAVSEAQSAASEAESLAADLLQDGIELRNDIGIRARHMLKKAAKKAKVMKAMKNTARARAAPKKAKRATPTKKATKKTMKAAK